ncbi:DUF3833 family protein [Roseibium litorale]|uniref:DUF3833 family protein n=1 Tax=Roseibium litorale TaxID=2803841 RepID=A0ABR9CRK6_9HYPH|nr:DUF3833 family protein [Roseibium litorale]MBD8893506.1 DUF3833 family protein [Roseibium litorale]
MPLKSLSFAAAGVLTLSSLFSSPLPAFAKTDKPLVLEEFFKGHTVGRGAFDSEIAGVHRPLTAYMIGSWNPKTFVFTLREDIRYDDGEREKAVWVFQKTGEGRYVGQRSGVKGLVQVTTTGGAIRFSYVMDVPTGSGTTALRFADTLTRTGSNTVRNTSEVTKLGFPVGTVDITFTR